MAIGFDKLTSDVNFDWLGEIPGKIEASRIRDVRKQSLANINVNDSKSLKNAGTRLFNAGDFEGGLKLIEQAKGLQQVEAQALGGEYWKQWIENQKKNPTTTVPVTGPSGVPPSINPFVPPVPGAPGAGPPPPASDSVFGPPPAPGSLPGGVGGALPAPGPRAEAPTEPPEVVKPYKVAGPADVAPPTEALAPQLPSWATAPGLAPVPGAKAGGPEGPAVRPFVPPPGLPAQELAQQEAQHYIQQLMFAPPGQYGANIRAGLMARAKDAMNRAQLEQVDKDWWNYNLERMSGDTPLPPLSKDAYKLRQAVGPDEFKAAQKYYDKYQEDRHKAEALKPALDTLERLVDHPAWESGPGTGAFNYFKSNLRNIAEAAERNGVPLPKDIREQIERATTSVTLRELATAVVGEAIFNRLGSLGAQTSDRDLEFTRGTFPSVGASRQGNKMIIEYYKGLIEKKRELGIQVQKVYRDHKDKGKDFSPLEIEDVVIAYRSNKHNDIFYNPDGTLTPLGQRMENEKAKLQNEKELPPRADGGPFNDLANLVGLGSERAAQQKAEAEAAAAAGRPPSAGWLGDFFRNITAGSPPRPGPTGGSGGPPSVGGSAGARQVPTGGRLPTFTGPDGRKFTWGPNGEHIPVGGP